MATLASLVKLTTLSLLSPLFYTYRKPSTSRQRLFGNIARLDQFLDESKYVFLQVFGQGSYVRQQSAVTHILRFSFWMQSLSSCGELILQDLLYNMQPVGRIWVCCIILNLNMHLAKESAHLICIHFSMAEVLSIAENFNINGTISSEIGTLSKLRELILQRTHISGTVPSEVGLLSNLGNYHFSFLLAP